MKISWCFIFPALITPSFHYLSSYLIGIILIISFVVVVIGGIGSVRGAFLGAIAIGIADAFGKVFLPSLAGAIVYALMAAVLVVRPTGLFGRSA